MARYFAKTSITAVTTTVSRLLFSIKIKSKNNILKCGKNQKKKHENFHFCWCWRSQLCYWHSIRGGCHCLILFKKKNCKVSFLHNFMVVTFSLLKRRDFAFILSSLFFYICYYFGIASLAVISSCGIYFCVFVICCYTTAQNNFSLFALLFHISMFFSLFFSTFTLARAYIAFIYACLQCVFARA